MSTTKEIERILIVRTDRLGDVVLTLPIIPILRSRFPNAHLAMLLKSYTGEIVDGNPYLDELLWYDSGDCLIPFAGMCQTLRARDFDAAIVVYPRLRLALLMRCAGIPIRIGTGYRYYSFLFNRRVFDHRSHAEFHEVEYNLRLLKKLDCGLPEEPEFSIPIPESAHEKIRGLITGSGKERIVVLHPGSGGSAREWPPEHFAGLANRLLDGGVGILFVTGVRAEKEKIHKVVSATGGRAVPLVDQLTVKELAALIMRASLFISNSTGPIHIASAVGTPVIGLYPQHRDMSAKRWGPLINAKRVFVPEKPPECTDCVGQEKKLCECMASITVDEVYRSALELIAEMERTDPDHIRKGVSL